MFLFRNSFAFLLAAAFVATHSMAKEVVEADKDGVRLVLGASTVPEILGEMVPVRLIFERTPLKVGDHLMIFADKHLAYAISPLGGFLLREFSGRVRMNQGTLEVDVMRQDGSTTRLSQRIAVDRPYLIPEDGEATREVKVRGRGNTIELIHRNRMARTNYVEHMDIVVPAGRLAISMTPYSSGTFAYYKIEAQHSLEGHNIDLRLATKRFDSQPPRPISESPQRLELVGFSLMPPQGSDWSVGDRTPYGVTFWKELWLDVVSLEGGNSATAPRTFFLNVSMVPSEGEAAGPFTSEYLKDTTKRRFTQMQTPRMNLVSYEADPYMTKGTECVRYRVRFEERDHPQLPRSTIVEMTGVGFTCRHPSSPHRAIDGKYTERRLRGAPERPAETHISEAEAALSSLTFTPLQ